MQVCLHASRLFTHYTTGICKKPGSGSEALKNFGYNPGITLIAYRALYQSLSINEEKFPSKEPLPGFLHIP